LHATGVDPPHSTIDGPNAPLLHEVNSVPKSRSKRSNYTPPKPPKPKPSPTWVPWLGLGLILLGVTLVILQYVVRLPGGNLNLVGGFVLMAAGLGVLSQWR
jgi:hypothetical protein